MSKLYTTLRRPEASRLASARHPSPHVEEARSRHTEARQTRHDVAVDVIRHILHAYLHIDASAENERVIQW